MELLSNGNRKYRYRKDLKVLTFGLPPIRTCPGAGECKKFCYAKAGRMLMPSATQVMERRFRASKRVNFFDMVTDELARRKCDMVRIHDSGDFYNAEYLGKWIGIAQRFPAKTFFAYTKMVRMFKAYECQGKSQLPGNLKIIYSMGGKFDHLIDAKKDNHARVFATQEDMNRAGYKSSPDNLPLSFHDDHIKNCPLSFRHDHRREGFVYHGVKKWINCGVK